MSFTVFAFSAIVLLLNCSVFTTGTNRVAELAENAMVSAGARGMGNFLDSIVAGMATSNVVSSNAIVNDVEACQMGSANIIIGEETQISAVSEQAAVLISAAADRCVTRIEEIIEQLAARLIGTAGSAVAMANSQIKLATGEINAITDRTVTEAQLIARSALATAEKTISSAAELCLAVSQSDKNAIRALADVAAQRTKILVEGLAGPMSVATKS